MDTCGPGPSSYLACGQCMRDRCGCLTAQESANPGITLARACISAQGCWNDQPCKDRCIEKHITAVKDVELWEAHLNCLLQNCNSACS